MRAPLFGELKAYRKALAVVDEETQAAAQEVIAGTKEPRNLLSTAFSWTCERLGLTIRSLYYLRYILAQYNAATS